MWQKFTNFPKVLLESKMKQAQREGNCLGMCPGMCKNGKPLPTQTWCTARKKKPHLLQVPLEGGRFELDMCFPGALETIRQSGSKFNYAVLVPHGIWFDRWQVVALFGPVCKRASRHLQWASARLWRKLYTAQFVMRVKHIQEGAARVKQKYRQTKLSE